MNQLAAIQNLDDYWHRIFEKCGLQVVMLRLDCRPGSKAMSLPEVEKTLGGELFNAGIGNYDSTFYPGAMDTRLSGIRWHFFHAQDLGKVMIHLKSRLTELGILENAVIYHVEQPRRMVIWYAPQSELIGFATDENDIPA
jgi:hypothetical protein